MQTIWTHPKDATLKIVWTGRELQLKSQRVIVDRFKWKALKDPTNDELVTAAREMRDENDV